MGFNIVKRIITTENNCGHKTLSIIWEMLPMLLCSFCCDENSKAIGCNITNCFVFIYFD